MVQKLFATDLRALGACEPIVEALEAEWPDGAEITEAVCLRAAELGADFHWAAKCFLLPSAQRAYWKAAGIAREACKEAMPPIQETYRHAATRAEYEKAMTPTWETFQRAMARAFYQAWQATMRALDASRFSSALYRKRKQK